jgi:hypothetical protein
MDGAGETDPPRPPGPGIDEFPGRGPHSKQSVREARVGR